MQSGLRLLNRIRLEGSFCWCWGIGIRFNIFVFIMSTGGFMMLEFIYLFIYFSLFFLVISGFINFLNFRIFFIFYFLKWILVTLGLGFNEKHNAIFEREMLFLYWATRTISPLFTMSFRSQVFFSLIFFWRELVGVFVAEVTVTVGSDVSISDQF